MDAATLPRVFDLFVQGKPLMERHLGGLGIGLSVVRTLVLLHGGSVGTHSAGSGQGSEFTIRLPLHAAVKVPAAVPPRPQAVATQRLLLVDDNAAAVRMMATLLRLEGHEVHVAHDALSALSALDNFTPTAIVLDIGLPVVDGYMLARRIRTHPVHQTTRLAALTGFGQQSDRGKAFSAGFDLHLVKPVEADQLLAALAQTQPSLDPAAP